MVALLTAFSIMYLHVPKWPAAFLYLLGFMAVGYPGWAEIPGPARYVDSALREVKPDTEREGLDRAVALNSLLANIIFFRLMSMSTYLGCMIPPIVKHVFWP